MLDAALCDCRRDAAHGIECGRGYDVMVACQLPKLIARVRFPLPAPISRQAFAADPTKEGRTGFTGSFTEPVHCLASSSLRMRSFSAAVRLT